MVKLKKIFNLTFFYGEKLIITEERLWEKDANKVKTKKNIFDFFIELWHN